MILIKLAFLITPIDDIGETEKNEIIIDHE